MEKKNQYKKNFPHLPEICDVPLALSFAHILLIVCLFYSLSLLCEFYVFGYIYTANISIVVIRKTVIYEMINTFGTVYVTYTCVGCLRGFPLVGKSLHIKLEK